MPLQPRGKSFTSTLHDPNAGGVARHGPPTSVLHSSPRAPQAVIGGVVGCSHLPTTLSQPCPQGCINPPIAVFSCSLADPSLHVSWFSSRSAHRIHTGLGRLQPDLRTEQRNSSAHRQTHLGASRLKVLPAMDGREYHPRQWNTLPRIPKEDNPRIQDIWNLPV